MVAHVGGRRSWWFRGFILVGLLCYGRPGVVDWVFSGEILIGWPDTDAEMPPSRPIRDKNGQAHGLCASLSRCEPSDRWEPSDRGVAPPCYLWRIS